MGTILKTEKEILDYYDQLMASTRKKVAEGNINTGMTAAKPSSTYLTLEKTTVNASVKKIPADPTILEHTHTGVKKDFIDTVLDQYQPARAERKTDLRPRKRLTNIAWQKAYGEWVESDNFHYSDVLPEKVMQNALTPHNNLFNPKQHWNQIDGEPIRICPKKRR